jgi:hypothetical protein
MKKKKESSEKIEARKNPIYLPISYDKYKDNKIKLLKVRLRVIDCVGHLENLRKLKEQKREMILELRKQLAECHVNFNGLNRDLPVVKNVLEIKRTTVTQKISFEKQVTMTTATHEVHSSGLDQELRAIQAKLNSLGYN